MAEVNPVPQVVVVGSGNVDLVARMAALPVPGETVLASEFSEHAGGKGSNQAIAAARAGSSVGFVGLTGADPGREVLIGTLTDAGVDVTHCPADATAPTGRALVMVDDTAENSIVVVPGTNALLSPSHVQRAAEMISAARVVVCQLETPLETVRAAAELCTGAFVFNPAPAQLLDDDLLGRVSVLVVNEGEYETVSGAPLADDPDQRADQLGNAGLGDSVVITLGGDGALVWHEGRFTHVAALRVDVRDTTGAGDTFVGTLADSLARGLTLTDAVRWAVVAGALATTRIGATSAMPQRTEVLHLAAQHGISLPGAG